MTHKEIALKDKRVWISFGANFKHIGVGFQLNRYQFTLDLLFFWFGLEW